MTEKKITGKKVTEKKITEKKLTEKKTTGKKLTEKVSHKKVKKDETRPENFLRKEKKETERDPGSGKKMRIWEPGHLVVGKKVLKDFFGKVYEGVVLSFNPDLKFYKVQYIDGDREDLEWFELHPILCLETEKKYEIFSTKSFEKKFEHQYQSFVFPVFGENLKFGDFFLREKMDGFGKKVIETFPIEKNKNGAESFENLVSESFREEPIRIEKSKSSRSRK